MNAQEFRNLIVQFAIQGKLIPQNPNDTPTIDLIEKIIEEKKELIYNKNAKGNKNTSVIFKKENHYYEQIGKKEAVCIDDEIPFKIPDTWTWYRLDEIGVYKKGPFGSALKKSIFVPKSDDSVKVYEQKNAIQKDSELGDYYITREYYDTKMKGFTVEPGDIIVSCAGTIGETYLMPDNIELGIINQALMRMNIVPSINLDYFLIYFDHILKKSAIENSKGSAIKNIPPFKIFKKLLFPLPPIEEQNRIVNVLMKVDEYVRLDNELSLLNNFFVDEFKKIILQEAVQGKLVPQNPNEEPASVLLEKIKQEKERLIKANKIKKNNKESVIYREGGHYYEQAGKKEPVCIDDEIPFEIPDSWEWCRLGFIGEWGAGATPKRGEPKYYSNGTIPWLKTGDLNNGIIDEIPEYITEVALKETSVKLNPIGSVLIAMYGATIGKLGILNIEATTNQACCACLPFTGIYNKYLFYYLMSQNKKFTSMGEGGAQPNISRTKIVNYLFPVPPLNEQKRIVDKINQLFDSVDVLIDD